MYFGLGLLESPEFIEVSLKDLVGAHIGDTDAKAKVVLRSARGLPAGWVGRDVEPALM
jgi:hypothetical protein